MRNYISTHKKLRTTAALILVAGSIFVLVWFQPQKLFIEETVNEAVPLFEVRPGTEESEAPEATEEPEVVAAGDFRSLEHGTSGKAKIISFPDGRSFFDSRTSTHPTGPTYASICRRSGLRRLVHLRRAVPGPRRPQRKPGDQNYAIPEGTDLERYRSAVIWCRRFTVGFGVAPLD